MSTKSVSGILTTLSQSNGKYKYDYATIPFLAELFKLSVSSFFLWKECQSSSPSRMTKEWRSVRLYLVPSIIYLIHNNVQFATLTYVDPSTYQIMGNLKIVTTGILFRLVLKRKLSNLQWMAIILLAVGTTTSQVKGCGDGTMQFSFFSTSAGLHAWAFETLWPVFQQVYSTSMAMLLTMVLSIYLFSVKATIQLFLGIIICIISLQMYFMPVHMLVELPQTLPVSSK
ncbi:hypothetical protein PR202_ga16303 [Eleusine coracana subsp. coracana]|uniref:CMP-sialic acid transporter 1 n=1 Tax=Eleusine coracana subsp. coracana TaxID=191504 RepID=A0AAV5CLB7_ELECO|nr:hypothetical protein PR202_ga16303 [Eleusine coracana subsp. coracana]